jgi:hypothetical protein
MDRACRAYGYIRNAYRILAGRTERLRPLGRRRIEGRIILK